MLKRVVGPTFYSHLRVLNSSGDSEMDILLVAGNPIHKTCVLTSERTTDCITDIVAERTDPVKHMGIDLQSNLLCRICRSHCCPTLAVDDNRRIDCMETFANLVHCVNIVDCHKVETETVDMVFLHPPFERFDHVFAEHGLLRCCFITAARAVIERTILSHSVEISWHRALETCL